ncbi:MAG: DUF1501 domain-containing protein [Phycisphaeraceae bacterium]
MNPIQERALELSRRYLLTRSAGLLGAAGLASLMNPSLLHAANPAKRPSDLPASTGLPGVPHHKPTAKRVIYLFLSDGPSHIDMFDYHPEMRKFHGQELPGSIRGDQRITGMTSGQKSFPCVAPMFEMKQFGQHQTWVNSDILPHTAKIVDDITLIKSMNTEAINHDPAMTYINTGTQQVGKPSMGAWLSYGLGSMNENLPAYVVMISKGAGQQQALFARLWGAGFLPSQHQGVQFRSGANPVLYLKDPDGVDRDTRRNMLNALNKLNEEEFDLFGDAETKTRIAQYEMAYRMQMSVPEVVSLDDEPAETFKLYGDAAKKPGSFAYNCVMARRLAERGVRFIQLFHRGFDQHGDLPNRLRAQCGDVDQACAGLVRDLQNRGMFDDTLVVCGGEFGRTIYSQGALSEKNHGRDHHGRAFTTWIAGGGAKRGIEYGRTDDYAYNIIENPVHINDLNATILHTLGIDHDRLTFKYQGLDQKLTGVEGAKVVKNVLA